MQIPAAPPANATLELTIINGNVRLATITGWTAGMTCPA
jgi:hypothetical protein